MDGKTCRFVVSCAKLRVTQNFEPHLHGHFLLIKIAPNQPHFYINATLLRVKMVKMSFDNESAPVDLRPVLTVFMERFG